MNAARRLAIALAGALSATAAAAQSAPNATTTGTIAVSVAVQKRCTVGSAILTFNDYTFDTPSTGSTTLQIRCTRGQSYAYDIQGGATGRTLVGPGGDVLTYELRTQFGAFPRSVSGGANDGSIQSIVINGTIPAGQASAAAGSYAGSAVLQVIY